MLKVQLAQAVSLHGVEPVLELIGEVFPHFSQDLDDVPTTVVHSIEELFEVLNGMAEADETKKH
jgi:hypothetical protein